MAWSGGHATPDGTDTAEAGYRWREVHLSAEEVAGYYHGFANRVLWPLCHYFLEKCDFRKGHWETFVRVNRKFAAEILAVAADDDIIWVHDYHLALVPHFLRPGLTRQRLGFFWHIPFPPRDLFRILRELERSGRELVGIFHSHPATAAYPSATDVQLAFYPEACYLILSLADPERPVLRAFRIAEGRVSEEPLVIA